jgi:putative ABC transport system substrate-binding protein
VRATTGALRSAQAGASSKKASSPKECDEWVRLADLLILSQQSRIVRFAVEHRIPAMYEFREFVSDGGLLSYGPNLMEMFRRSATYADRILKGTKPADLPVEQATKFDLVINLKTAKALGLTIPQSLLLRADQVIE